MNIPCFHRLKGGFDTLAKTPTFVIIFPTFLLSFMRQRRCPAAWLSSLRTRYARVAAGARFCCPTALLLEDKTRLRRFVFVVLSLRYLRTMARAPPPSQKLVRHASESWYLLPSTPTRQTPASAGVTTKDQASWSTPIRSWNSPVTD